MKIGIPREMLSGETRIAATPDTVTNMVKAGMTVSVTTEAGLSALLGDETYRQAGASIAPNNETLFKESDVLLKVNKPQLVDKKNHELDFFKENAILICPLSPLQHLDLLPRLNNKKITAFSLDLLPRIARAQSMDILSSMSNLAGYKSIIMAANHLNKLFPMMTTAAGTILPAKVIVLGAGVAGLQAIATAHRLGAIVLAFDTRPAAAEQVKSLGAEFVSLETNHEQSQDTSGYAKEQSEAFYQREQDIIRPYLKDCDVIVTTALIPGKRAPILITDNMVKEMKQGAVMVDLAIEQQGNCTLTIPGEIVIRHGVTIIGLGNLPTTLPIHATQLYAKNVWAFLNYISPQLETLQFDTTDDIIKGCLVTSKGEIIHPAVKQAVSIASY